MRLLFMLRAALFLFTFHRAAAGPRIYSLTPSGGPVLGDTAITVLGHDLENIECVFALPKAYRQDRPPSVGAICQYNAQADDAGFRCVCVAPPAPRLAKLQDVVDEESALWGSGSWVTFMTVILTTTRNNI